MDTKKDIETREDIVVLVEHFYEKVKKDETIGIVFTKIVPLDWDHHIPLIADFWETALLGKMTYKKNAMAVHYDINKKFSLQEQHFDAWLNLWFLTIDELYTGKIAELAKKRATDIGRLMLYKMTNQHPIL